MSFWATSSGEQASGDVQETSFDPLPKGGYPALFETVEIDEYEGQKKIKLKARIIDGEFKNRVMFLNLKAFEGPDIKETARDRALQVLVKMYQVLNKGKLPNGEPDDRTLSVLADKPLDIMLDKWVIKKPGEEDKSGNWLVNVAAKGEEAGKDKKASPKPDFSDIDKDIPF